MEKKEKLKPFPGAEVSDTTKLNSSKTAGFSLLLK